MKKIKFTRYFILIIILWTAAISFAIYLSVIDRRLQLTENENVIARIAYEKDIMYRRWVSKHGGVYVPITDHTKPNPYLVHSQRVVVTTGGDSLTLVNPAYMTRMVYEYSQKDYNMPGHLISLNPVNPLNTPNKSEAAALLALEQGSSEYIFDTIINNKKYLQYIRPFVTEESCLSCHGAQGYKVGDIRGAISIAVPVDGLENAMKKNIKSVALNYFVIWILGVIALLYILDKLKRELRFRLRAESDLEHSRAELKAIYDHSPVMMCVVDRERSVLYANPAFTALTGTPEQMLKGGKACGVFGCINSFEDTRGCGFGKNCKNCGLLSAIEDTFQSGSSHINIEFNSEIITKGELREVSLLGSTTIIENQKQRTLLLCLQDITIRKQAEDTVRELEVARESAKRKQNFLANMSHEIRTPLTGVLGMIELLENTGLNKDQKDFIHTLKVSGENLKEIINQVLDYSKIEAGKVNLNPVVFKVADLLKDTEILYRNLARPGIEFNSYQDPAIPVYICADKHRLAQVINNITSNALKFTSQGSVAIIAHLALSENGNEKNIIRIEVSDTGKGIPLQKQKNLFVPFFQIEDNDRRDYDGTGLGLSISKQLVELMGGEIGLTSKPGKGSIFWFTFPFNVAQSPPNSTIPSFDSAINHKLKILIVDDKAVNQKVIKLLLASMGHELIVANNGQEAIDLYEPNKYDLIIMDIQMPVMDGVTATQKLKETYDDLPPIVGLSANAFEGDREKYMAMGMDEYLTKPVKKEDFETLIGKLFSQPQNPQSG